MGVCESACDSFKGDCRIILSNPTSVLSTQPNVFKRIDQNYPDLLVGLIASIDISLNISNIHPVKLGKMFAKHFNGITNMV